jgi:beta-lactamase class A
MVKARFRTGLLLAVGGLVVGYSLFRLPAATASNRSDPPPANAVSVAAPPARTENALPPAAPAFSLDALDADVRTYLSNQPGRWGFYLIDLRTGKSAGQDATEMFPAASTIKLPLALYVLDEVAQGRASLDEQIVYQESDWQDGAGFLVTELSPGDTMTVGSLIDIMIRHSDNVAKNMLMRRFDQDGLFAWIRAQGGQVELRDDGDGGLIYTNAETLARMMRLLYQDQAFRNPTLRQRLLTALQTTVYTDRAAAGVPDGVKVAHKVGNLPEVVNDVALVWAPHGPFIIASLSEGVEDEVGNETISTLTAKAYQFLEQHHQSQ